MSLIRPRLLSFGTIENEIEVISTPLPGFKRLIKLRGLPCFNTASPRFTIRLVSFHKGMTSAIAATHANAV